jgi:GT2 family glycosyltransferase
MDKVGIVVLNYLNYKDTIECVKSLSDLNYDNYKIVVVDNGSDNESYKVLNNEFNKSSNIHLLNTGENLGYAKGNNYGIDFCRHELNTDHVMIINNDTVAKDKELLNVLVNNKDKGIVLGPKIINLDGQNQNPLLAFPQKTIIIRIIRLISERLLSFFVNIKHSLFGQPQKNNSKNKDDLKHFDKKKLFLHGSCLFFANEYFRYYNGFFSKTFLYFEEDILFLLVKKINKNLAYISDTSILHKEDKSSELAFGNKETVKNKHSDQSFKWYLLLYFLPYSLIKKFFKI